MENEDGRQLLVEALVLLGVLLLLMEHRLNGGVRERLLVAFFRTSVLQKYQILTCYACYVLHFLLYLPLLYHL